MNIPTMARASQYETRASATGMPAEVQDAR